MLYNCYSDPMEDMAIGVESAPIWSMEANNFDEMKKQINTEMCEQGFKDRYWFETELLGLRALTNGNFEYIIEGTL